ncbi:hypothetical protein PG985_014684 [Apiospora marii]|uniref:uncharacterized protein n=1 Tax=Apiospora marii TaxID=335849 RepID=UPI00312EE912
MPPFRNRAARSSPWPTTPKRTTRSRTPDPLIDEGPTIVVRADCGNVPTPNPTEPPRKNTIEDRPAQQKDKACHLLQEALRLVQEAKESYSGFDYTAATQNLEALATDKTPTQDPQNPNRTPDCCNALQELASLRKEVQELKDLLTLTPKPIDSTPKGNTYSEALEKGRATTVKDQVTTKSQNASPPEPQKANDRKEHTLVLIKDKDQALPRFDPVLIRDRINARLQCNAIKGVHTSPKGNVVLTSLSLTASQLLQEQQRWQDVFQGWPITAAEKPETWPKLVAHFVPTSLSPTSFAEEVKQFNDIEIQGNVRWLSKPEGKAHSSMVFATQEVDRANCLKHGIWIQGQHLQVVRFKSFTPKTQCRRCLKLGHDPVICRRRLQSLFQIALEHQSHILCLQEPYLFQDKGPQGSGLYSCISHPSFRPLVPQESTDLSSIQTRPRVVTYIRKSFPFEVNPRFDLVSDPYMQVLEVITPIENFYIVNIYNQTDEKGSFTVQRFLDLNPPITPALIVGDLNLHHPWWNPLARSSPLSERLTGYLHAAQATLLIDHATIESQGGTFHRPNSRKTSVIDLAFSIGFRSLHWQDWSYLPGTGSDHEAVSLRAFLPAYQAARPRPPQFCTKKADWERFRRQLREVAVSLESTIDAAADRGDFESVALSLQRAIEVATNESIPVKRPCDRSKAWWCPDLTVQRMRYHRAFRRYKRTPSRETETACKEARNSYFQAIDRAKTDHWFTFLAEANGKEIFTAYSYTKPRTDPFIPTLRYEVSGKEEIVNSFSGKCEALVSTLFKGIQQSEHPPSSPTLPPLPPPSPIGPRSRARSNSKADWQWPTLAAIEIGKAIPQKDTAPGEDRINWRIIREAYAAIPHVFYKAYKALFHSGYHPAAWKTAIGVVLPKRNKPDYSRPKAYRPISLLPCLSKLLEKLFANRLAPSGSSICPTS